jgi:hypothetical protein
MPVGRGDTVARGRDLDAGDGSVVLSEYCHWSPFIVMGTSLNCIYFFSSSPHILNAFSPYTCVSKASPNLPAPFGEFYHLSASFFLYYSI